MEVQTDNKVIFISQKYGKVYDRLLSFTPIYKIGLGLLNVLCTEIRQLQIYFL